MIKHIVSFKLKDSTPENITIAVNKIRAMNGKIPELKFLEVGVDYVRSPRSFDFILISHFETHEDLEVYRTHPEHLPVLEYLGQNCQNIIAVDYVV